MMQILLLLATLTGQAGEVSAPTPPKIVTSAVDTTPLRSAVRLRVFSNLDGTNPLVWHCSGTVIRSTPEQSFVLTCEHIFQHRTAGTKIEIDLFDGIPRGPAEQAAKIATHLVDGLIADPANDLAVVWFRPGRILPVNRIAPTTWEPKPGDPMKVVGCRDGADPNTFHCNIRSPEWTREPDLSSDYIGIQCTAAAYRGRSGGGLFNTDNFLCGVLNRCSGFDDGYRGTSVYAHPKTIRRFLDKHNLSYLYASK